MGIWSCGTLRSNRLRGGQIEDDKVLQQRGRGAYTSITDKTHGVTVVKWFDNRSVMLSSTFLGIEPVVMKKRYDRKNKRYIEVPTPAIVVDYNRSMGGVDLNNMLT